MAGGRGIFRPGSRTAYHQPKRFFSASAGIPDQDITPYGFDDHDAVSNVSITLNVAPVSIPPSERLGSATVAAVSTVAPLGITSQEQSGNPSVAHTLTQVGIQSNEQVSQATVSTTYTIAPIGIPSSATSGNHSIAQVSTIAPTGIPSSEGSGYPTLTTVYTITTYGVPSAERLGFSTTTLNVVPIGISSTEATGYSSISNVSTLSPVGIKSTEALGNSAVTPGTATIQPTSISSGETFGSQTITLNVTVKSIDSSERLGYPTVANVSTIAPQGIPSQEATGNPSITSSLTISTLGIYSTNEIGFPTISQPVTGGFTVVQDWVTNDTGSNTSPANVSVSLGATATALNTLLVVVNSDATVATPSGYTLIESSIHNAGCYIFGKISNGSETGVTITPNVNASTCVAMAEFSGMTGASIASQVDQTASNGSASIVGTRSTGTTSATTQNDEYVLGIWGYTADQAIFAGGGGNKWLSQTNSFVEKVDIGTTKSTGTNVGICLASIIFSTTGAAESTATSTLATAAESMIVTFKVTVGASAQGVSVVGIPSPEAFGNASVGAGLNPASINTQETFGNTSVTAGAITVAPTGIPTQGALGTITTSLFVQAASVPSAETVGSPTVSNVVSIVPVGINSDQRFGTQTITLNVAPIGIPSAEALGSPTASLVATPTISPVGVAANEQFGNIAVTAGTVTISPVGIVTQESVGSGFSVLNVTTISPVGVPGSERFGSAAISHTLNITGISTSSTFGNPTVSTGAVTVAPVGIPTEQSVGFSSISLVTTISAYGIPSDHKLGSPVASVTVQPRSIESNSTFGNISISTGAITLSPVGIRSSERFGIYTFNATGPGLQLVLVGITSSSVVGSPIIALVADVITDPSKPVPFDDVDEFVSGIGSYKGINDDLLAEVISGASFAGPVVRQG